VSDRDRARVAPVVSASGEVYERQPRAGGKQDFAARPATCKPALVGLGLIPPAGEKHRILEPNIVAVDLQPRYAKPQFAFVRTFCRHMRGNKRIRLQDERLAALWQREREPPLPEPDRPDPLSIREDMGVRLVRQLESFVEQPREQARFGFRDFWPLRDMRQAGVLTMLGLEVRMGLDEDSAVGESGAVTAVEIRFRRQSFNEKNIVFVEFDVPIFYLLHLDLDDRAAVNEMADRDQHALVGDAMSRAQPKIAARLGVAKGARRDAHRPYGAGIAMAAAVEGAMADPLDGEWLARGRDDEIADREVFDRYLATICKDPRSRGETRRYVAYRP